MNESRLRRLANELAADLEVYLQLKSDIDDAYRRIGDREPDAFELRAIGSMLHDVYAGAERICRHIAKEIDRKMPVGPSWHVELLDQMARPFPKARPAVLHSDTVKQLEDYRSFRHVVHHLYGHDLDWDQLKPLLENASEAIDAFVENIEGFVAFLRLMATTESPDTNAEGG